ncbi:MAG: hypothetical protein JWM12_3748, partial [Ilumatobacteraceae bacterium]|nr:hypothetical protein [Ilumatobacteraceae bacterium]
MIERFDGIASRVPPRLRAFGKRLLR